MLTTWAWIEGGVEGQGPCDADPLPLAAGELVGEAVGVVFIEAHHFQQLIHPFPPLLLIGEEAVDFQRLLDDLADGEEGV